MASSTGKRKHDEGSDPEDSEVEEVSPPKSSAADKVKEDECKKECFARKFKVSERTDAEILGMSLCHNSTRLNAHMLYIRDPASVMALESVRPLSFTRDRLYQW